MKEKLILLVVGTVLGIACGVGGGYLAMRMLHRGTEFSSVGDFRQAITEHNSGDVHADESLSLRSLIQPHPSDSIIYTMRPNLKIKFQGVEVRTNSFGHRGPERSVEKPADVFRLALLGDSFAFGWGVDEDKSFASVIERELPPLLSPQKKRVEVINFGVPGYSTFQEVAQFLEQGWQFSPDAVLVYFVENDFGMPFFIHSLDGGSDPVPVLSVLERITHPSNDSDRLQKKKIEQLADPNRALQRLLTATKEHGIPLFLTINPRREWEADWKRLWVLPANPEIHFLRLREPFVAEVEARKLTLADLQLPADPHPSALKHEMLGRLLAQQIAPVMENRPRP